ncbi:hypothetical protein EMPS_01863 [Entomortierella parvispora]|uniref:Uncharacterized protein n=1 Tax=Entomortierella parvispora TaxID=205924 RepID=A0A9P3LT69_9FUNG|nr:hypothetical protein EMPS_01863 [Entomortierella parvispora]
MSKPTIDPFTNTVIYAPATVHAQRGGVLYDRLMNAMATSPYLPRKLVESMLLYVEVAVVGVPEWIFGETNGEAPTVEKRIDSSIAASRLIMADTVARGDRRKVAVLTGGAGGLGLVTAKAIAEAGYHVIIGDRAREDGEKVVATIKEQTRNENVEFIYLDLASLEEVKKFSREVQKRTNTIDLLINNAGVMDIPEFRPTAEGYDCQFGINHLGHYYLTHLLLPLVKKAPKARIVMTASAAHYGAQSINYESLTDASKYDRLHNYCESKLATVMFARHLAKTLKETDPQITVNCLHPGSCNTNLFKSSLQLQVMTTIGLQLLLRPASRGARTIVYLSLSEEVEGISGEYWFDERMRQRSQASNDVAKQEELMRFSNKAAGIASL